MLEEGFGEEVAVGEHDDQGLEAEGHKGDLLEVARVGFAEAFEAEQGAGGIGRLAEENFEALAEFGRDGVFDAGERVADPQGVGIRFETLQAAVFQGRAARLTGEAGKFKYIAGAEESRCFDGGVEAALGSAWPENPNGLKRFA